MVRRTHDHRLTAPPLRLRNNFVDVGNIGAGGIKHRDIPFGKIPVNSLPLSMGADNDPEAVWNLLRPLHRPNALSGQTVYHIFVVNDGAQHDAGDALGGLLLRQFHRPADAVAEAGGLGQHDPSHPTPSPRARTRSIRFWAMT